jgi:hypothetical protein
VNAAPEGPATTNLEQSAKSDIRGCTGVRQQNSQKMAADFKGLLGSFCKK